MGCVFTGVGKVNASYICMKAIAFYRPSLLINYGTAGGIRTGPDQVVKLAQAFNVIWMSAHSGLKVQLPLITARLQ